MDNIEIPKLKSKMNSRTWILTVYWNLLVLIAIILQIFVKIELPIGSIVTLAGTVTALYLGKRTLQKHDEAKNGS